MLLHKIWKVPLLWRKYSSWDSVFSYDICNTIDRQRIIRSTPTLFLSMCHGFCYCSTKMALTKCWQTFGWTKLASRVLASGLMINAQINKVRCANSCVDATFVAECQNVSWNKSKNSQAAVRKILWPWIMIDSQKIM
jgi:hypothetical protein